MTSNQRYFVDLVGALFLLADADLPRSCCGDLVAATRLRLFATGTADFLGLEATAGDFDFAGDFCAGEDLAAAAGERTLPRVTRFSVDDGVFEADRLALRGILMISEIQSQVNHQQHYSNKTSNFFDLSAGMKSYLTW